MEDSAIVKLTGKAYIFVLFISILAFSTQLLDYTLLPRFLMLSFGLLLIVPFIWKEYKARNDIKISLPHLLLSSFYVFNLISVFRAVNFAEAIFESQRIFLTLITFAITIYFIKQKGFLVHLTKAMIVIASLGILIGVFQLVTLKEYALQNLYQVNSISGHKNLFSSVLFLLLPFSFAGILLFEKIWQRISYISAGLLFIMMIVLQTRAVWMGMIVTVIVWFFVNRKNYLLEKTSIKRTLALSSFIFLVTLILFYLVAVTGSIESFFFWKYVSSLSAQERLLLWEKTLLLAKDYPWFGVGAGNWQVMFPSKSIEGLWNAEFNNVTFQRPHNDFLWMISELGIAGFLLYCAFIFSVLFPAFKFIKQNNTLNAKIIKIFFVFYIGFLVISFLDFPKERIEHNVISYTILGIIYALTVTKPKKFGNYSKASILVLLLLTCLLSFNVFIGIKRWNGEKYMSKVLVYKQRSDWEKVIRNCDKAISLFYSVDPTTVPVSWYRGIANFSLNNINEAFKDFSNAEIESPFNHYVYNDLGSTYEMMGNHAKSQEYYLKSLQISPSFEDPKFNLAAVYFNLKEKEKALFWLQKVEKNLQKKEEYERVINESGK